MYWDTLQIMIRNNSVAHSYSKCIRIINNKWSEQRSTTNVDFDQDFRHGLTLIATDTKQFYDITKQIYYLLRITQLQNNNEILQFLFHCKNSNILKNSLLIQQLQSEICG